MANAGIGRRAAAVAASLVVMAVAAPAAFAQNGGGTAQSVDNKRVSLVLENADIRYALKMLFNNVGVNYALDPSVQGTVTVSLNDVPFRTALETLLRNAGTATPLTYRQDNGIYMIAPRVEQIETTEPAAPEPPATPKLRPIKIQVNFADPIDIARALGGGYIETRFEQLGATGMSGAGGIGGGYGGGFGGGGMGGYGGGLGGGGFGGGGYGGFGGGGFGGFGGGNFGGGGFGGGNFGGGNFGGGGFGRGGFGGGGFGGGFPGGGGFGR